MVRVGRVWLGMFYEVVLVDMVAGGEAKNVYMFTIWGTEDSREPNGKRHTYKLPTTSINADGLWILDWTRVVGGGLAVVILAGLSSGSRDEH